MSKQFIKAVKATKKLAPHELMALLVLLKGQEREYEEPVEARLDQPLKPSEHEKDYDLDDQDLSEPIPSKTQLDIELLNYRIRDPRISDEERKRIALEIWNLQLE